MKFKKVFSVLALAAVLPLSACNKKQEGKGVHTLNDYLTVCPSNWNELTYQDNNDTEIMGYIGGSFFNFDFKFDANGDILPGEFEIKYGALKKIEDITESLGAQNKFGLTSANTKNHAFRMTLRDDLKWDDGTPIKAKDFVYTMKQQLDPAYQNYRADSFYIGSRVIHNAQGYNKQGQKGYFPADQVYPTLAGNEGKMYFHLAPAAEASDYSGVDAYFRVNIGFPASYDIDKTIAWMNANALGGDADVLKSMEGKTVAEILANDAMKAEFDKIVAWWQEGDDGINDFCSAFFEYPAMNFDQVGLYAEDDYNLVISLDNELEIFDEEGKLTYHAPYEFSSLPLVKEELFEKCRVPAATEGALPTYKYNTNVETSASWGPYKLTYFQAGKQYKLERNNNWYGYNMEENKGLYQTDNIVVDIIAEPATAWQTFLKGDLASIGISPALNNTEYKTSSNAYFTASDFVSSLQLQSDVEALAGREKANEDKEILGNVNFRKAISLSIDREDFNKKTTTASLPGFGLFNSMHYYDVAHGGVYRNTDYAKKVICDVYGVEYTNDNLDAKYKSVTGYDVAQAKALYDKAYDECIEAGTMTASDKVVLTMGTSEINVSTQLFFDTFVAAIENATKGTKLEGKISFSLEAHQEKWADDFRDGAYDICSGGWSGAAWNPGYFLLAYLSPDYMYSTAWETDKAMLKFKPEGATEEYNMTLMEWYDCLNGNSGCKYNWAEGSADTNFRLSIIAALEKEVLSVYYTVPISNSFSASLLYNKVSYVTRDYNTFMGYGGIKYMTYNYDDYDWEQVKGDQDYKK